MRWRWRDGCWEGPNRCAASAGQGVGVFTTVACVAGAPLLWGRHRARVVASLRVLWPGTRIELPGRSDLLALLAEGSPAACARLRLTIHRPAPTQEWRVEADVQPFLAVAGCCAEPVRLEPVEILAPIPGVGHKVLDRRPWETARSVALRHGADDAVLVTDEGWVLETSTANVLAVSGRVVATPPAPGGCLPGVMRGWLLERLGQLGCRVEERPLQLTQLLKSDEVWITNALVGVRRVACVGAGAWSRWPLYESLRALGVPAPGWAGRSG